MTCSPTGSPSLLTPAGSEIAGFQHRLASMVNGTAMPGGTSRPLISMRHRAGGGKRGHRGGRRQQHVDVVEDRGHLVLEPVPVAHAAGELA